MAFFTINDTLHQKHLFSITLCKYPSSLHTSNFHYSSHFLTFSPPKHSFSPKKSPLFLVSSHVNHITGHEPSTRTVNFRTSRETASRDKRVGGKSVEQGNVSLVEEEEIGKRFTNDVYTKKMVGSRNRREMGSGLSSMRSKYASSEVNSVETSNISLVNGKMNKTLRKVDRNSKVGEKKMQRVSKKIPGELEWRVKLDMCSKRGDVMGAIDLYDEAMKKGIKMGQYHYTVLLYLCSWAAVGVVHPAKSGSGSRSLSLNALNSFNEVSTVGSVDFKEFRDMGKRDYNGSDFNSPHSGNRKVTELGKNRRDNGKELNSTRILKEVTKNDLGRNSYEEENSIQFSEFTSANLKIIDGRTRKGDNESANLRNGNADQEKNEILVSEDIKKYALQRGFDIYEMMRLEKVPMNEATLTSVARMAMSMGDGDMAFDMVKQMKTLGIDPRLRSYDPALSAYCKSGDSDKAFAVEKHMLEHGVHPEEPELEALLSVSIEASKSDKVYYLLHKLRSSVRKVSPSTADLIEKWFKGKDASRVGKRKWDKKLIRQAIDNGGGGWHGQGWLGQGKWTVTHTTVADDGLCKCCEEKLTTIDLDPTETENFAESVASIAARREKHSSFQKFQKWLDYYGPFEAVVDAANVGLFSQKRFIPSKINAVVNGIRQMLPSKKWPLIILHNRRVTGNKMDEPLNKALIEKWKIADALYATPTGSNDDWYWLYAAIKFKCLLVTNDEMRDHTFQLLGNDFFPKWKERHQVHFEFSDSGPIFHMPPPCSVVIQESESGHWHIPIASENDSEGERTWLCITRSNSDMKTQGSTTRSRGSDTHDEVQTQGSREVSRNPQQDNYTNLRTILSESVFSDHPTSTILSEIEDDRIISV